MAQQVLPGATAPIPYSVFDPLGSVSRYLTIERAPDSGHQRCRPMSEKRHSEEAGAEQGKKDSRGSAEIPRQSWLSRSKQDAAYEKQAPNLSPSKDTTTLAEVTVPMARLEGHLENSWETGMTEGKHRKM